MKLEITIRGPGEGGSYPIEIGPGVLGKIGNRIADVLGKAPEMAAIISNKKVFGLYGEHAAGSIASAGPEVSTHLIGDGERFKNFRTLERTIGFLLEKGLGRTDVIVALGGGVVGDLAGFAASIYLRGVPLIQVPTTLLSMIDSSVGGKTAVNTSFGKNLIGTFYQPSAVLIDPAVLSTLAEREVRAGLFEAVKHAALSGQRLLSETEAMISILESGKRAGSTETNALFEGLGSGIGAHIEFKAGIVSGDEREKTDRVDARSRKILNFGHTFGHAIEKITGYRSLLHGEAVGHGILFAAALSNNLGLLAEHELKLLYDVVYRVGPLPPIDKIDPREIFATFEYDKKRINDTVQWILLEGIGRPVIVPHTQIPEAAFMSAFKQVTNH
ncbi:MAG: 3-dehydroquinate synthase [Pyrinomonadaceae bacterium]